MLRWVLTKIYSAEGHAVALATSGTKAKRYLDITARNLSTNALIAAIDTATLS